MSAIGLFGPLNHFLYAAGMILVSGSQMLYGRYLARDREKIHGLFTVDILVSASLSLLISAPLAVGVVTGAARILVSQEPDLQMLNRYILGQAIGIPALVLGQQLFAFLSLENQTKRTMAASVLCFAVNGVLDHLFLVVIPMDTFGLGLSTSLASWVFLVFMAVWYVSGKSEWKFSFRSCRRRDALQIARLGYPGALSRFVETFRCLIVNFLVLNYVGSVGLSAFAASNSLLAVIAGSAWITLKRFPLTLEDQMAIPKTFGVEEDERIDITVRSMDEVVQVSRRVIDFCDKRGVDGRRSFLAGLCMEEMAGNIVTHGFSKDRKNHSVDIRVIHGRDEIILRIRDNCSAFNPTEYARAMEPGEMGRNVGIRLVYNMAGSVNYQNLLGMNVLTIRI